MSILKKYESPYLVLWKDPNSAAFVCQDYENRIRAGRRPQYLVEPGTLAERKIFVRALRSWMDEMGLDRSQATSGRDWWLFRDDLRDVRVIRTRTIERELPADLLQKGEDKELKAFREAIRQVYPTSKAKMFVPPIVEDNGAQSEPFIVSFPGDASFYRASVLSSGEFVVFWSKTSPGADTDWFRVGDFSPIYCKVALAAILARAGSHKIGEVLALLVPRSSEVGKRTGHHTFLEQVRQMTAGLKAGASITVHNAQPQTYVAGGFIGEIRKPF